MTCQCSCCQQHIVDVVTIQRALAEAQEESRMATASFNSEWARATRALVSATIAAKERDAATDAAHRSRCDLLDAQTRIDRMLRVVEAAERWAEDSSGDDLTNSQSSLNLGHAVLAYRKSAP